jgi:protoheme IX farnesyltransferase
MSTETSNPATRAASLSPPRTNSVRAYYELIKPGIVYSNVMTAAAGFLFACKWEVDFGLLISLILGTAFIIASACVFNNYIDRGIDAKMIRTKKRATASGKINGLAVNIYASLLGIIGFIILTNTNMLTVIIGAVAFVSYVVLYGIAKRKTVHGTLVGTIPGAASLIAGYTAITGRLNTVTLLLFLIMLTWQMAHFYSIAMFRLEDYKKAKIPVMPAVVGMKATKLQILLYIFALVISITAMSFFGYTGLTFLVSMASLGLYWLYKGIKGVSTHEDTKWARGMFGFSLIVLLAFSLVISLDSFLP